MRFSLAVFLPLAVFTTTLFAADPVPVEKLVPFLPQAPKNWKANKPRTQTAESEGKKQTRVEMNYDETLESSSGYATIEIKDMNADRETLQRLVEAWKRKDDIRPSSYSKAVTMGGYPGREESQGSIQTHTLRVAVAERYLVMVSAQNIPVELFPEWTKLVDWKKLSELQ